MAEKNIEKIKSLDELEKGDIVDFLQTHPRGIGGPHIIAAIGDVPEHEREVLLHPIHCPECPDDYNGIRYERKIIHESELDSQSPGLKFELRRKNRSDYKGWKYAEIKMID